MRNNGVLSRYLALVVVAILLPAAAAAEDRFCTAQWAEGLFPSRGLNVS